MSKRRFKKRIAKILTIIAASTLGVVSFYQLYSLGRGVLGRRQEVVAEAQIQVPTPKYPYKSCGSKNTSEFAGEFKPDRIVIDNVDIDLAVVSVPLKNGTWQVNAKVANFAEGTSLVNSKTGNVGLFAHDRNPGFTNIKKLNQGDTIVLYGEYEKHLLKATYSVESASVTLPSDVEVYKPTEEPFLTLVTCTGNFSQKRHILKAKLVSIEELNCNGQTN